MKRYRQYCGIARALDVVGERWTLLIVRELLLGPRRYADLLRTLEGITTNLLAKRLRELVQRGLITRATLPHPARVPIYRLTESGQDLEPVLLALGAWGAAHNFAPARGDRANVGWFLFSLKRRYAGGGDGQVVAVVSEQRAFRLTLGKTRLEVTEGEGAVANAELHGSFAALRRLFFGGVSLDALVASQEIALRGDGSALVPLLT